MRSKGLSTSRTYTMSPRAKFILDAISIMSVGIDKSELVNMAVFNLAAEVMTRRDPDVAHITVRNAVDEKHWAVSMGRHYCPDCRGVEQ